MKRIRSDSLALDLANRARIQQLQADIRSKGLKATFNQTLNWIISLDGSFVQAREALAGSLEGLAGRYFKDDTQESADKLLPRPPEAP